MPAIIPRMRLRLTANQSQLKNWTNCAVFRRTHMFHALVVRWRIPLPTNIKRFTKKESPRRFPIPSDASFSNWNWKCSVLVLLHLSQSKRTIVKLNLLEWLTISAPAGQQYLRYCTQRCKPHFASLPSAFNLIQINNVFLIHLRQQSS